MRMTLGWCRFPHELLHAFRLRDRGVLPRARRGATTTALTVPAHAHHPTTRGPSEEEAAAVTPALAPDRAGAERAGDEPAD